MSGGLSWGNETFLPNYQLTPPLFWYQLIPCSPPFGTHDRTSLFCSWSGQSCEKAHWKPTFRRDFPAPSPHSLSQTRKGEIIFSGRLKGPATFVLISHPLASCLRHNSDCLVHTRNILESLRDYTHSNHLGGYTLKMEETSWRIPRRKSAILTCDV